MRDKKVMLATIALEPSKPPFEGLLDTTERESSILKATVYAGLDDLGPTTAVLLRYARYSLYYREAWQRPAHKKLDVP
jgi:hypothetical protein